MNGCTDATQCLDKLLQLRLDARTLQVARRANHWLKTLKEQPETAERLALKGYYLEQAIGQKAQDALTETCRAQEVAETEIGQALALLSQLNEGQNCASLALEEAVLLAETEAFSQRRNITPVRRFLEQSRSYLKLSPAAIARLNQPHKEDADGACVATENDHATASPTSWTDKDSTRRYKRRRLRPTDDDLGNDLGGNSLSAESSDQHLDSFL